MKKLFERSVYLLITVAVLAVSGLRLDYAPAAAYDVLSSVGADGKPLTSSTTMLVDQYGTQNYMAPNGEVTSIPLYKLVGDPFTGSVLDPGIWTSTLAASGVATVGSGQLTMSTGTVANGSSVVQSVHLGRFSGLAPNKARITLQIPDGGFVDNTRRWGVFAATDGAFYEFSGHTFCVVTRRASTDTKFCNGSLTGSYGPIFAQGTTLHFYEIIYQPRQIVFAADNRIIQRVVPTSAPWTNTLHLPLRYENVNANGSTSNVSMLVRLGTIARFGIPQTQPDGYLQQGLTAGVQLKYGPGNYHYLVVSGVTNGAIVTLYDGTSTAGRVIETTGAMGPQTAPLAIPGGGEAFNDGLFLTVTGAAANAKVVFD